MKIVIVLMFVALMIAAVAWWRSLLRNRGAFIDNYPYAKFLDKRLAARRPELNEEQRRLVFDALRAYFHLCREAKSRMVAMPSQAVDDAWHEFILFTRQYQRFCADAFGRFLHHTPAEAMRTPTQAQDGIKRAWHLACRREGINPKTPQKLPLLFALDAMLGIAGGFVYRLDCMAATQAGTGAGTGYCASHIGCGGGGATGEGNSDSCSGDSSGDGGGCGGD
ncbi:MAG: hypothetical protein HY777_16085 [Betaproteobacteria bacterium]|nr:hypothetical protein [Betaproteobacteria bacterium]